MGMNKMRPLPLDLWTDEDLIELPLDVKWTAVGLRLHADDQGRETTTAWKLLPSIWPGNRDVDEDVLIEHLLLLDQIGYIGIYSAAGKTYYALRAWPAVSHAAPSKHPPPPADLFQNASGPDPETFSAWESESGERAEGGARGRPAGLPPSPFCKVHQPAGTTDDCRHCGTARLAHQQYLAEQRASVGDDDG